MVRFPECEVPGCKESALAMQTTCRDHCENWNRFVDTARDLLASSQELEGLNFTGITLEDIDLTGRQLTNCCFDHASLRRLCLADATLVHVSLAYVVATEMEAPRLFTASCILAGSELTNVEFGGGDLLRSSFVGVQANDVNFDGSDLSDSRFSWARFERVSLRDCNLQQAHFVGTDLTNVPMHESNVQDAKLE